MSSGVSAAFCGILTALAVVFMLLVPVIPVMLYCAPVLSGLCVAIAADEFGVRYSFCVYLAASILSFLLAADKETALVFILLAGAYPVLKFALAESKLHIFERRSARIVVKLLYINAACISYYFAATKLFGIPESSFGAKLYKVIFLFAGNAIMLCFDRAIDNALLIYRLRIRDKLKFR